MGSLDLAGNFSGGTLHQTGGVVRARAATLNHGTVQFDAGSFSVGTLSLSSFGQFILGPGADKVVRTTAIQLVGPGSKIDLGEAAAVVDYNGGSPLLQIRSWLVFGYNGGTWDGGLGIGTRFGSATTHGIGYAEAADVGTPAPIFGAVDADTVLLRFTRYGDADLNGVVNLDDFNRLATNFGSSSGAVWSQGDFTYDGSVNLDDFNRLAANFGFAASGPTVTPLDWSALISAVPEPTLPLLAVPTLVFLRRRHRVAAAAQ
jgi:hypothetical protein